MKCNILIAKNLQVWYYNTFRYRHENQYFVFFFLITIQENLTYGHTRNTQWRGQSGPFGGNTPLENKFVNSLDFSNKL